jgi:hypothetical protein
MIVIVIIVIQIVLAQKGYAETLEVIVNEAAILYKKLVKEFTDETMTKAIADNSTNLLLPMSYCRTCSCTIT